MNLRRLQDRVRGHLPINSVAMQRTQMPVPLPAEGDNTPPLYDSQPRNVVIFGETGAGKSSVINLIAGAKIAEISPDAAASTLAAKSYHVVLESHQPFCIWDTVGLNEAGLVREDYLRAIEKAYELINKLESSGGVHLLLLCMRGGRITNSVQQNYKLFSSILCEKQVPLGIVVTNLENEACMEEWWNTNKESFEQCGVSASGHACITATPGLDDVYMTKYQESREIMHRLLLALSSNTAWKKEKRTWFINLLGKMAGMLPPLRNGRSNPTRKELIGKLVKDCKFSQREAEGIATSIEDIRHANEQSAARTLR
ncbi:hypothetical protein BS17DRAFT_747379 [Gyrodon lividus]|nr:hypothetical protein BS17DRAFT_747379 [Gyrodon lividus]